MTRIILVLVRTIIEILSKGRYRVGRVAADATGPTSSLFIVNIIKSLH